jgi:hypothetical protein
MMQFKVALPLTLLAQAVGSSAIPNTALTLDTRAANGVEKRDTNVLNVLFEHMDILGLFKHSWLFFETTHGQNAGCAAMTKEGGLVEHGMGWFTDKAYLPKWPNGTYPLADLFGNGKTGDDACQYKNDDTVRNAAVHSTIARHGRIVSAHSTSARPRYCLIAERNLSVPTSYPNVQNPGAIWCKDNGNWYKLSNCNREDAADKQAWMDCGDYGKRLPVVNCEWEG